VRFSAIQLSQASLADNAFDEARHEALLLEYTGVMPKACHLLLGGFRHGLSSFGWLQNVTLGRRFCQAINPIGWWHHSQGLAKLAAKMNAISLEQTVAPCWPVAGKYAQGV
jgi:hypothetical protein